MMNHRSGEKDSYETWGWVGCVYRIEWQHHPAIIPFSERKGLANRKCLHVCLSVCPTDQKAAFRNKRGTAQLLSKTYWLAEPQWKFVQKLDLSIVYDWVNTIIRHCLSKEQLVISQKWDTCLVLTTHSAIYQRWASPSPDFELLWF